MKKFTIYSGIEPGKKGAGMFIQYFLRQCENNNVFFTLKYIPTPQNSLVKILKKAPFYDSLKNLYYHVYRAISSKNIDVKGKVLIFHPQSLGLDYTKNIIINTTEVFIYIFDNFFFCIKSYNYIPDNNTECLLCINNLAASRQKGCESFPNKIGYEKYLSFIELLKYYNEKITFLVQNQSQEDLIFQMFGRKSKIKTLGMFTGEFSLSVDREPLNIKTEFDFIFHNTLVEAKGILFFIKLCEALPFKTFLIPFKKIEVEKIIGRSLKLKNLVFYPCNWDSGLRDFIRSSKITVVPSLWSSPVEGSLIKSLYYSKNVAVVDIKTSFVSEIPDTICIKLPPSISKSVDLLLEHLKDDDDLNLNAKKWVIQYCENSKNNIVQFLKS
ncbi:hypothetical protein GYM62_09305 [Algoriphagus sp. NBT04N3]|jgi:hypothetical protein|uniref:glycosyltransferase n=1 Tax=Algoriphagus sp. NBT04N3 TaxID=2705473 RepID=UPI001C635A14|nr:glycosyltransferase [Algoriphagus sp. NBT04N3]QYH38977.1 hypothetical protein GYM62_09305 [Algoriphagus sp. NBT04N3]